MNGCFRYDISREKGGGLRDSHEISKYPRFARVAAPDATGVGGSSHRVEGPERRAIAPTGVWTALVASLRGVLGIRKAPPPRGDGRNGAAAQPAPSFRPFALSPFRPFVLSSPDIQAHTTDSISSPAPKPTARAPGLLAALPPFHASPSSFLRLVLVRGQSHMLDLSRSRG